MNINNINTTLSQNKYKNSVSSPSFSSIMPVKVFIDDLPSTNRSNAKRAIRGLSKILFNSAKNENDKAIKESFSKYDRDFRHIDDEGDKSKWLRNLPQKGGISYLFTGPQAEELDALGRKIGPEKNIGLQKLGTARTFEARAKAHDYFNQIKKFIESHNGAWIRESINPQTGIYEGKELGLCIFAKSEGVYGKRGFKLNIDKITFRKIDSAPKPVVEKVPQADKPPAQPNQETTAAKQESAKKPKRTSKNKVLEQSWPEAMNANAQLKQDGLQYSLF